MIHQFVRFIQQLVGADTIDEIIFDRLLPDEEIIMIDGPAQVAYFVSHAKAIAVLVACLVLAYVSTSTGMTAIIMGVAFVTISWLMYGAFKLHYTRYVVTTTRILYLEGVLKRTHQWIPWAKVTDLSYVQTMADRIQNIGRVRIESANEASAFKLMKDLTNPETMMRVLVFMVSQRQGSVAMPKDIHAQLGIRGPDGLLHMPGGPDDPDGGSGGDEPDGDGPGGGGPGGGGAGGDGPDGGGPDQGRGGGPDQTVALNVPYRPGATASGEPPGPGTATVPRPDRGEESRPSRANPVSDVDGTGPRRRPDPPGQAGGPEGEQSEDPAEAPGPPTSRSQPWSDDSAVL